MIKLTVALRLTVVSAVVLALPVSLLAGEGVIGSGKRPLAAVLPSMELGNLKLAADEAGALAGSQFPINGQGRLRSSASSSKKETPSQALSASRWDRRLYFSAALAISAGVLARWTEWEADRSYDKYLQSASPKRQKSTFDRAEQYDRLSGAALVTMEAGIILSTYLLFF